MSSATREEEVRNRRKPWSSRKIWSSFGIGLAIFMLIGVISAIETRKLVNASDKSIKANEVLISLEELFSTLQNAETWQLGYLITGDEHFLEPYLRSRAALPGELANLDKLSVNSPEIALDVKTLKPLVADELAEMHRSIDEREHLGLPKAAATIESGREKKDMEEIRRVIGLQQSKLERIVEQRTKICRSCARRAQIALWLFRFFAGGLLLLSMYHLYREYSARHEAANELGRLNNELESRVQERTAEMTRANAALRTEILERKRVQTELNFQKSLFKSVSESSIDGILVVSLKERNLLYFNHRFAEMWDFPEEILKNRLDDRALRWAAEQMADPAEFMKSVVSAYERLDLELHDEIQLKDGRTFDRHGVSIRNAQGDNYGWVWSFRDITGHKRAEQELSDAKSNLELRVKERTAQLEAVNKGLEAFAYSISHDLRSPIRTIGSFAELLSEEQAGRFDADGATMLNAIKQCATNMDGMVTGMLELARLGQRPMAKSKVDMNRLARDVISELLPEKSRGRVTVNIHPLPCAYGNETALRLVLENLLSNALKYTRNREYPVIEVGARHEDAEQIYYVKDNGAGFDMRQKDKLFVPFQRLHGGEFEGTGVGLATVSRIINHLGGRVWAEGKVDEGATFFFSLPTPPD